MQSEPVRCEAWSVTTKEGANPYVPEKKPRTSKHFVHVNNETDAR